MRGGAVAARRAHNPKVAGSSPAPATNKDHDLFVVFVFKVCTLRASPNPLLRDNQRPPGYPKQAGPAVFDLESIRKKEIFYEPATHRIPVSKFAIYTDHTSCIA